MVMYHTDPETPEMGIGILRYDLTNPAIGWRAASPRLFV